MRKADVIEGYFRTCGRASRHSALHAAVPHWRFADIPAMFCATPSPHRHHGQPFPTKPESGRAQPAFGARPRAPGRTPGGHSRHGPCDRGRAGRVPRAAHRRRRAARRHRSGRGRSRVAEPARESRPGATVLPQPAALQRRAVDRAVDRRAAACVDAGSCRLRDADQRLRDAGVPLHGPVPTVHGARGCFRAASCLRVSSAGVFFGFFWCFIPRAGTPPTPAA